MSGSIELFEHQKTALNLMRIFNGYALFMEQGTGKTFPVLFRLAELAQTKRINSALVLAPPSVVSSWEAQVEKLDDVRKEALNSIALTITSYSLAWRRPEIYEGHFDCVVLDEAHFIKTPSSKRTKCALKLCSRAEFRYILTGTPTSNGQLCNLWSLFSAITPIVKRGHVYPTAFGHTEGISYYNWLNEYAYLNKWRQPYKYKYVNQIQDVIANHAFRITKEECLDLPEKLPDNIIKVDLDKCSTRKAYDEMMKASVLEDIDLMATNSLSRTLRLRQIASGFVKDGEETLVHLGNEKISALEELLTDFEKKVVIFCEFQYSIDKVSTLLDKMKLKHVIVDGRQQNKSIWRQFQADKNIRAIICQYQSGAAGIDLFAADTMVFYEPCLSSNLHEQAKDRIHRVGQRCPCSYYYLLAKNSIDEAIYNALKGYSDFNEALFNQHVHEYTKGKKWS